MDEITTLTEISEFYHYGGKHFGEYIVVYGEGIEYYTFHNEHYDEHYRICYDAAMNFINTSNVFSELKPEEIIKAFADMEFKDNKILIGSVWFVYCYRLELFEELLRINKEMLLALIKAFNEKKITYRESYYFIDNNGVLGARRGISDHTMIRLYRILLEYNHFSLDNLNLGNLLTEISPPMTKRAV